MAEVVILQHPLEVCHPKGSARLLHLCLQGSRLVVGEVFGQEQLFDLLYRPLDSRTDDTCARQPVLLYPESQALPQGPHVGGNASAADNLRLVILDGTWRKSRKMLHLNPLLQTLPRLSLSHMPASRYAIRRAHRSDQLSTLEAACHALAMLESNEDKYKSLLNAFDQFVSQQEQWFKR